MNQWDEYCISITFPKVKVLNKSTHLAKLLTTKRIPANISASSMKWVVRRTTRPARLFFRRSQRCLREYGSIPAVGSSRNNICNNERYYQLFTAECKIMVVYNNSFCECLSMCVYMLLAIYRWRCFRVIATKALCSPVWAWCICAIINTLMRHNLL